MVVLLAVYRVFTYRPMFLVCFRKGAVSYHRATLPGNQYKLVSHIWTIFRIRITIYIDYQLFWLFCVLICYYVYHYVHYMFCILCVCKNVIT